MKYSYLILFFLFPLFGFSQTISGTVTNTENEPQADVTVIVKSTTIATKTNEQGRFTLTLPNPKCTLLFTALGFEGITYPLTGQNEITVVLKTKSNSLDEVHVIAYGTSTQRNTVGSISKVSGKDISQQPITNPLAGLEGRVPGLSIT